MTATLKLVVLRPSKDIASRMDFKSTNVVCDVETSVHSTDICTFVAILKRNTKTYVICTLYVTASLQNFRGLSTIFVGHKQGVVLR